MSQDVVKLKEVIKKYKSKSVTKENVEDLVCGEDVISLKMLDLMSEEKAIEDTLDQLRQDFWKKKFTLSEYL